VSCLSLAVLLISIAQAVHPLVHTDSIVFGKEEAVIPPRSGRVIGLVPNHLAPSLCLEWAELMKLFSVAIIIALLPGKGKIRFSDKRHETTGDDTFALCLGFLQDLW